MKEKIKPLLPYIIIIAVVLFIKAFIVTPIKVNGESMYPTFYDNDILILNKLKYRFSDIERGDVVALRFEDTNYLIKRVIGLPGEVVEFKDNQLYVNGEVVEEDYLEDDVITEDFQLSQIGYEKIPEGMYFVLGDNREHSSDSRELGLVTERDILGETSIRIFPFNRIKIFK